MVSLNIESTCTYRENMKILKIKLLLGISNFNIYALSFYNMSARSNDHGCTENQADSTVK